MLKNLFFLSFLLISNYCLAESFPSLLNQQINSQEIDNQQINQDEGYGLDDAEYYNAEGNEENSEINAS